MIGAGDKDLERASHALAARLPGPLAVLARLAFNYRWSWVPGGPELFREVDPHRWGKCGENPVRLLQEVGVVVTPGVGFGPQGEGCPNRSYQWGLPGWQDYRGLAPIYSGRTDDEGRLELHGIVPGVALESRSFANPLLPPPTDQGARLRLIAR